MAPYRSGKSGSPRGDVQQSAELGISELFQQAGAGSGFARGLVPIRFTLESDDICRFGIIFRERFWRNDTGGPTDTLYGPASSRLVGEPAFRTVFAVYRAGCHGVSCRLIYGQK